MFVTIAVILLIAGLYVIGKQRNLFGSVFHLRAMFSNVGGLKMGNNVRFGGINIGTVDGIDLITDTSVLVEMIIHKDVQKFIKKDALASIGSDGLMGDRVVVISPGTMTLVAVKENETLATHAPAETYQILESLKTSADNAAVITKDLADISRKINKGNGVVARLIGDTALSSNLKKTVVNLKKGSEGLNENMEAARHNFLLRGYFKKKRREEDKKKQEASEADNKQSEKPAGNH